MSKNATGSFLRAMMNGSDKFKSYDDLETAKSDPNTCITIANLADRILTAKKKSSHADTIELEREIDKLVYQLYDLTKEEIKIVEGI